MSRKETVSQRAARAARGAQAALLLRQPYLVTRLSAQWVKESLPHLRQELIER